MLGDDGAAARGPRTDGWGPAASFVVEFQIRDGAASIPERISVHHVEDDRTEILAGVDPAPLWAWMIARLPSTGSIVIPLTAAIETGGDALALGEPWSVVFAWSTGEARLPQGEWQLDVILDAIRGRAVRLRDAPVPVPSPAGATAFRERYAVAPGALPADLAGTLVHGTATLTFRADGSDRPMLACVADLGRVQIWDPGRGSGRIAHR